MVSRRQPPPAENRALGAPVACRPACLDPPPPGLKPEAPPSCHAVYNRDNRLKVARDEAKYEAEQAEVRARAEAADRERRRQLLLERARQRFGVRRTLLFGPSICCGVPCRPCVAAPGSHHRPQGVLQLVPSLHAIPCCRATAVGPLISS